jgi:alkaline phosphatase
VKWRNQLLALFCLFVFAAFGVFYFQHWVVQKPFGIILFIGEGLAPGRLAATRIYAGGVETPLALDSLSHTALLKNYSNDFATPDQAAAATALATGVKVNNGALGVDPDGEALANLIELARESGRTTGLVTNTTLTDPTVAAFYAHTGTKDDRADLARVLVESAHIDVILGGGAVDFLPKSKGGHRTDERDLLLEIRQTGYDLVRTKAELEAVPRWRMPQVFGVFSKAELAFADEIEAGSEHPSLADMVRRGIELLQFNPGGYLLVVDAGSMRIPALKNLAERTLAETVELDRAVSVAMRYVGGKSTIFVCGDVAIGGLNLNGFPSREAAGVASLGLTSNGTPSLTWATGPNGTKPDSIQSIETPPDQIDAAVPSASPTPKGQAPAALFAEAALNTADDVLALGTGPGAEALHGILDSTAVFEIIRDTL